MRDTDKTIVTELLLIKSVLLKFLKFLVTLLVKTFFVTVAHFFFFFIVFRRYKIFIVNFKVKNSINSNIYKNFK